MKDKPTILFIGGGTGGHIFPLRNLADEFITQKWATSLVLSDAALDRKIAIENFGDIDTIFFKTAKIRRYLDWRNIAAPGKILYSILKAYKLLKKEQPEILFFKGGFVGFPFLIAASVMNLTKKHKIQLYSHESDASVGALTKIARSLADKVFESFGEPPLPLFFSPQGIQNTVNTSLPKILIFGGSQGAQFLNNLFIHNSGEILEQFQVTLVTGLNKAITIDHPHFTQHELLPVTDLSQKIHESDLIISRAGANSLFEIVSAKKPSIIIPLPSAARNHQALNADWFKRRNLCAVYPQDSTKDFMRKIEMTLNSKIIKGALEKSNIQNTAPQICQTIHKNFRRDN